MANNIRGQWASSSNLSEKRKELERAHKEFLDMLANGYKIKSSKPKRPRIQKVRQPRYIVTLVFGEEMKMTIEDYTKRCSDFPKVREIF